jgi:hypothetical protein
MVRVNPEQRFQEWWRQERHRHHSAGCSGELEWRSWCCLRQQLMEDEEFARYRFADRRDYAKNMARWSRQPKRREARRRYALRVRAR